MNLDLLWHKTLGRPHRLYSCTSGSPEKPTIVLLHGIAASGDDWRQIVKTLEHDYYCVTIDLLGFAKSPKPQWAEYTLDQHVRSIAYTIRRLGLPPQFILAGHSMGSFIATRYSVIHKRRISRLLLLSPPIYPPLISISKKSALKRTDWLLQLYKFLRTHPRMGPSTMKNISQIMLLPVSVQDDTATWIPFARSLEKCIEQQTIKEDISGLEMPIDVFYGSLDLVVIPRNVESLRDIRNVTLHKFRGNHNMGRIYAKTVASVLPSTTRPSRRRK